MGVAAAAALEIPRPLVNGAGALVGGYLIGALPLAAIVLGVLRWRGGPPPGRAQPAGRRGPRAGAARELMALGGVRIAAIVLLLELLKGAVVGLGARAYDDSAVFAAYAIAGCVVGDAFPPARSGRRGVIPLISGTFSALPGAWAAGTVIALPAVVVVALSGAFEGAVMVCVPLALLLGTRDVAVLVPAAIIAAALVARHRLRRRARDLAIGPDAVGGTGSPMVVDHPVR